MEEAGLPANSKNLPFGKDALLASLMELTRRLGRLPRYADILMARKADPTMPSWQALRRLGVLSERVRLARAYAASHPECADLLGLLREPSEEADADGEAADDPEQDRGRNGDRDGDGSVYLARHGKHYKVGHSYDVPRRHREIQLELPEKLTQIHVMRTDDPSGIEAYWKNRFSSKRTNGEWFRLTRDDIRAFKRRRFM